MNVQPGESPEKTLSTPLHRDYLIDEGRRLHANHLGWVSIYDHGIESVRLGAELVQKALGYRFVISEFTYLKRINSKERIGVNTDIDSFTVVEFDDIKGDDSLSYQK